MQYWSDLGFTDIKFDKSGGMSVSNTQPACIRGPAGEQNFFNIASMAAFRKEGALMTITYGNGEIIEDEVTADIVRAQWQAVYATMIPEPHFHIAVEIMWACMCQENASSHVAISICVLQSCMVNCMCLVAVV